MWRESASKKSAIVSQTGEGREGSMRDVKFSAMGISSTCKLYV